MLANWRRDTGQEEREEGGGGKRRRRRRRTGRREGKTERNVLKMKDGVLEDEQWTLKATR